MSQTSQRQVANSQQSKSASNSSITSMYTPLRRYCEFLCSSPHDAEDLLQTTLLKALPVLKNEKYHPNVPALLRRIAKNTWIDSLRKDAPSHLCEPQELRSVAVADNTDTADVLDALQVLMQRLTAQQQVVLLLCDVFRYTDREAAALLETSPGAVKATLHRARLRLVPVQQDTEVAPRVDESQIKILDAYAAAFQSADIRMLVQLCQDGVLDPVQATGTALTVAETLIPNQTDSRTDKTWRTTLYDRAA
ncbi:RNA polymerase sigma factor [Alicyclobacillus sp. SO9]|uniref:RNA polymerase sigma factor n=1 Tax=Alicyclobacillus sp. SO9 TaxID=2665646 RepID=UPI0018E78918|nr:RNA polymerase sigma factor [Alicyclobacillus sp. SO9]QQE76810.1 RNA polymerase sigma factor [Alicyclobacillus sp. SO9]